MVLHVRCVPKRTDKQRNLGLRGGSVELYSSRGLLGVCPKFNVPHRLEMGKLMSI